MTKPDRGREAFSAGAWRDAFALYREAESEGAVLDVEDVERMAAAAWLVGEEATELMGRACDGYEKEDRPHDAARVALDLADYHGMMMEFGRAMGWGRQANRLLESAPEGSGHGRLEVMHGLMAVFAGKVEEALQHVERGHALARAYDDPSTESLSLSRRAALLLRLGRVEEATADVDEAMLLVHRGRVEPIKGAMIYCSTIDFCRNLGDYDRALEWTEAATRWIDTRQVCGFMGLCRVHRAELLRLRGEHDQADTELRDAIALFGRYGFRRGLAEAFSELGRHRLELDALEEAARAFAEADEIGHEALPGTAELALRRGDAAGARAMLATALEELRGSPLGRAKLLPTMVTACLEDGDPASARAAQEELGSLAQQFGTVGIQAQAETAATRVHLAADEVCEAIRTGRAATRAWNMIGARFELARARELLASAYESSGDHVRANLERERVRATREAMASSAATVAASVDDLSGRVVIVPDTADGEALPAPLSDALPIREGRELVDKIVIGRVLGIGGMGVVHAGKHLITGRDVAVKVLKPSVCGDSRSCERFLSEARACGKIRHQNVVDIYDAGMLGQEPYIVMELLEGRSLEDIITDGDSLPMARMLDICAQAARGVSAAHEVGVIHRDLKPGNIFVSDRGVKVLDFGISKQLDAAQTETGRIVGTPFYMAPEQIRRPDRVDARTDVYALGAVLFELLTGHPPFVADAVHALLYAITDGPEPDLRADAPTVSAEVEALVLRALARDPDVRFDTAAELAEALANLSDG